MYNLFKNCVFAMVVLFSVFSTAMKKADMFMGEYSSVPLLEQYSSVVDVPMDALSTPSIDALKLIVSKHTEKIPYQNFDIFYDKKVPNLSIDALRYKLLFKKEGGACYETSELLFNVLSNIGYVVSRIPAFPLNNKPFNPSIPSSHNILLVDIEHSFFLIDVGYGINSLRFPVKFSFMETEEQELFPNEKYQLVCAADYYQLNMQIKGDWASMYRFDRPIHSINLEETVKNFQLLSTCKERIPIRDVYVKSSILTPDGRIGFYVEPGGTMSSAYRIISDKSVINKKLYKTPLEFADDILSATGLRVPEAMFKI